MKYAATIPHGIMFHHFHNDFHYRGQGSIDSAEFEKLLLFVGVERIINPETWVERLSNNSLKEDDVCLTFDDGLLCQFDIALPILKKYNLKAFWFVYSCVFESGIGEFEIYRVFRTKYFNTIDDFYGEFLKLINSSPYFKKSKNAVSEFDIDAYRKIFPFYSENDVIFRVIRDRALTKDEFNHVMETLMGLYKINKKNLCENIWMHDDHIRQLSDQGHHIGFHSYTHPTALSDLPYVEQENEYLKNFSHLKKICGKSPISMAHPVNSYNENTIKILKKIGIECGFQSNMQMRTKSTEIKYELPREDHTNILKTIKNI